MIELKRLGHPFPFPELKRLESHAVGVSALVMGFSWAVFIAQVVLEDMLHNVAGHRPARSLAHARRVPVLGPGGRVVGYKYIDDFGEVGTEALGPVHENVMIWSKSTILLRPGPSCGERAQGLRREKYTTEKPLEPGAWSD